MKIHRLENLHILFWLLKDMSWLLMWRGLGMFMILPTLTCAIIITWRKREFKSELYHNLAITFWIMANSFWMITEFFGMEAQFKIFAIIPFSIGLLIIVNYYLGFAMKLLTARSQAHFNKNHNGHN